MEKYKASRKTVENHRRMPSTDSRDYLIVHRGSIMRRENSSSIRCSSTSPTRHLQPDAPSPKKKALKLERIVEKAEKVKKGKKEKKKKKSEKVEKDEFLDLKDLRPLNIAREKQIFWDTDFSYNPIFLYNVPLSKQERPRPHDKYLEIAIKILERKRECREQSRGGVLTVEETVDEFDRYISMLDIGALIRYEFAEHTVAPTSVKHNNLECMSRVIIGLPIHYSRDTIRGVLNHEIGTHFLRKNNDRLQRWHKERRKHGMKPYLKHEEGLAALNQASEYAWQEQPALLFTAALHYYACFMADRLTFAQLFKDLEKYQADPELRWRECIRVKRGFEDTSALGGMLKDQIYLRGAVSILKHRHELDFQMLHCGKMSVKDCLRLQKGGIRLEGCKLPFFIADMDRYMRALDRIAKDNYID
jgi:hypothetical protein